MSWSSAPKKAHADLAAASAPGCAHPDAASTSTPGLAPAEAKPAAARVERRRGIRYRCEGSADFRAEGSDVRIWGSLSDISQDGCYIEMTATFPVATIANLVLEANGIRLRLKGRVQVNYPFLGMGMRFSEVSEEQRAPLQELLDSLSKPAAPHPEGSPDSEGTPAAKPPTGTSMPVIVDPSAALNAIVRFFQTEQSLTREEFLDLICISQPRAKAASISL